jgi:hypothetical protein
MEIHQSLGSEREITGNRHEYWAQRGACMLLVKQGLIGSDPCR